MALGDILLKTLFRTRFENLERSAMGHWGHRSPEDRFSLSGLSWKRPQTVCSLIRCLARVWTG